MKMIDLSGAKVGDKYLDENNNEVELSFVAKCGEFKYILCGVTGGGFCNIYNSSGKNKQRHCVNLVSKIHPRPWLKDMPDAGIFADNVCSLHMSKSGCWFYKRKGVDYHYDLCGAVKMPTLSGKQ